MPNELTPPPDNAANSYGLDIPHGQPEEYGSIADIWSQLNDTLLSNQQTWNNLSERLAKLDQYLNGRQGSEIVCDRTYQRERMRAHQTLWNNTLGTLVYGAGI